MSDIVVTGLRKRFGATVALDGLSFTVAPGEVTGFVEKKVPLILGPSFTATCQADGPLVAKTGPVDYCLSPSIAPAPGSFQYSSTVSTRDDAKARESIPL